MKWKNVRPAKDFGPVCAQFDISVVGGPTGEEGNIFASTYIDPKFFSNLTKPQFSIMMEFTDCLHLAVHTPDVSSNFGDFYCKSGYHTD